MSVERDQVVEDVIDLVRRDVRDLVYAGKDPQAIKLLVTHTLGSMRALASVLAMSSSPRAFRLTHEEVEDCKAARLMLPEDVRWLWDNAVLCGANPLSLAKVVQDSVVESYAQDDEPPVFGL